MSERHPAIVRWSAIEDADPWRYDPQAEPMGLDTDYSRHFGFARVGLHHHRLLPGRRSSFPHAESAEDEFVYVLEGTPDVWLDGALHRLALGDAVGLPAGTGLCHAFLNNTDVEVRLLVAGDRAQPGNTTFYPLDPEGASSPEEAWTDAPSRERGPHDGLTDARRDDLATRGDQPAERS